MPKSCGWSEGINKSLLKEEIWLKPCEQDPDLGIIMEKQLLSPVSNLVISSLNNDSPAASRHGALMQLPWAGDTLLTGLLEGVGQMGSHESLAPQSSPHPSCLLGPPSRFTLFYPGHRVLLHFPENQGEENKVGLSSLSLFCLFGVHFHEILKCVTVS